MMDEANSDGGADRHLRRVRLLVLRPPAGREVHQDIDVGCVEPQARGRSMMTLGMQVQPASIKGSVHFFSLTRSASAAPAVFVPSVVIACLFRADIAKPILSVRR
jgi:hypothetical protein